MAPAGSVGTLPLVSGVVLVLFCAASAQAQQRPLLTEDAATIGSGRVLIEGGIDYQHELVYPVSGLTGNLTRIPSAGS